ncbi:site-specific integrase [Paraburkholderia bannensis]|uniref:site-specific integrase n=1 Tax=Paraburkholderia bannensis TaxID=765414 RepID=UPI002AB6FFDE|nr:site-specific integrase [Paraburkholderia bannensis]
MATIRVRKNGRFQAIVRVIGFPADSKTFDRHDDAVMWAAFRERELGKLISRFPPAAPDMTLSQALERYKHEVSALKKSWLQEFKRIDCWLRHPLAKKCLKDITGADLAFHRSIRLTLGKKHNTVRLELALISHVFEVARADWGLEFLTNPRKAMRRMKMGAGRDRRLRAGEFDALMNWCDTKGWTRLKVAIILAVETAMRRGELVSLRWENTDLFERLAHLPETKNDGARTVPLSTAATAALASFGPHKTGLVFDRSDSWVTRSFSEARAGCGISNLTFHDLRHEAVSRLFEKGFNMMEAATVSGHKTLQMLKRYTHLDPRKLIDRLE